MQRVGPARRGARLLLGPEHDRGDRTQRGAKTSHGIVSEARVFRYRDGYERMCELHEKSGAGPQ